MLTAKGSKQSIRKSRVSMTVDDIDAIRNEHGLGLEEQMLLIFMWVTDEELRLIFMHPECLSWDVTHQTNNEKRDLLIGCFKDGDNRAFHACHSFILNQRRWVFSLFFRECAA